MSESEKYCSLCPEKAEFLSISNNDKTKKEDYRCNRHLFNVPKLDVNLGDRYSAINRGPDVQGFTFNSVSESIPSPYFTKDDSVYSERERQLIKQNRYLDKNGIPKMVVLFSLGENRFYDIVEDKGSFYIVDNDKDSISFSVYKFMRYLSNFLYAWCPKLNKYDIENLFTIKESGKKDETITIQWMEIKLPSDVLIPKDKRLYNYIDSFNSDTSDYYNKKISNSIDILDENTIERVFSLNNEYDESITKYIESGDSYYDDYYDKNLPLTGIDIRHLPAEYIDISIEIEKKTLNSIYGLPSTRSFLYFDVVIDFVNYMKIMFYKVFGDDDSYTAYTTSGGCESEYIIVPYEERYHAQYIKHYDKLIATGSTDANPVSRSYMQSMRDDLNKFTLLAIDPEGEVLGVIKMSYHRSEQLQKYQIYALTKCAWEIKNILDIDNIDNIGVDKDDVIPLVSNCMFLHLTTVIPTKRQLYLSVILKFMMFKLIYETRTYMAITHILSESLNPISVHVSKKFNAKVYTGLEKPDTINVLSELLNVNGGDFDTIINVNNPGFLKSLNVIDEQIHNCELKYQKKVENRPKRQRGEEEEEEGEERKRQRTKMFINMDYFV